jgi:hypothetical protein
MQFRNAGLLLLGLLAGCAGSEATGPAEPPALAAAKGTTTNQGPRICAWASYGDGDLGEFFSSEMRSDGSWAIIELLNDGQDGTTPYYIDSDPAAGLTTVYGLDSVTVRGQLPVRVWLGVFVPGPTPTKVVTMKVDLKLTVDHESPRAWFMSLAGTLDDTIPVRQVDRLQRFQQYSQGKRWYGESSALTVCSK